MLGGNLIIVEVIFIQKYRTFNLPSITVYTTLAKYKPKAESAESRGIWLCIVALSVPPSSSQLGKWFCTEKKIENISNQPFTSC